MTRLNKDPRWQGLEAGMPPPGLDRNAFNLNQKHQKLLQVLLSFDILWDMNQIDFFDM